MITFLKRIHQSGRTVSTVVAFLAASSALWAQANTPPIRIGIIWDPVHPVSWSDGGLEKLKAIGFNEVQLNLAWGSHPTGDPITLCDIVTVPGEPELPGTPERRKELSRRVELAQRHGLRMLLHLGSPYMDYNPYTGEVPRIPYHVDDTTTDSWYEILNPKVRDHELALLREFRRQFPQVEDVLVYNYDVEAWQTPEFQYTKFSYGIPLAERLSGYLSAFHQVWTEGREGKARMWWEPWELSAGQIYTMLPKLPRKDFGLMLHSNIAESQLALPVDLWFRNTARMCQQWGIPVVAHAFFAATSEEIEPLSIPAPRLVDEQYQTFLRVSGIVGIKEYYGINTPQPDLNIDLLQARLHDPTAATDELLARITARFGSAQSSVLTYLELLTEARRVYPWDASWQAREIGRASVDHGWNAATIKGGAATTPSWQSSRHALFMRLDNTQPHFWMLEDVGLRCKLTAERLEKAIAEGERLLPKLSDSRNRTEFERIQKDADYFRRIALSYALHLRETNVAQMLRQDLDEGRPLTAALLAELGQLLDQDVANQGGKGRAAEMRRLFQQDATAFLHRYLLPDGKSDPSASPFTLTTR
jgi:hypothetical protein